MKKGREDVMLVNTATINTDVNEQGILTIKIDGRLDSTTTSDMWLKATKALEQTSATKVIVDASKINYCDGSGVGLLIELYRRQQKAGGELEIRGLRAEFQKLMDLFGPAEFEEPHIAKPKKAKLPEEVGRATFTVWENIRTQISFLGELVVALIYAAGNPRRVRWKDAFLIAETAGVNAFPIIALISFLIGLIMAFQAAIPMRQFGAEIFVADLIALSVYPVSL